VRGCHPELARTLTTGSTGLAEETARRHLAERPELVERFPAAHERCVEDGGFHVRHLAAALAMGRPELFDEYVAWTRDLLVGLGIEPDELNRHLQVLTEVIATVTDPHDAATVRQVVDASLALHTARPAVPRSLLEDDRRHGELSREFLAALLRADRRRAAEMILGAADDCVPIEELYLEVFQPCLYEVGWLWQTGQASVAQEHLVSAAVQLAMAQLYPRLFAAPRIGHSVVVASVGGELHEIGGRMVADIFELHGWDSHFTGANTPSASVARMVADVAPQAIAISATLPSHVWSVEEAIREIRAVSSAPILVGGRPFNQVPDLWQVVAADATARDAVTAVATATTLIEVA